MNIRADRLRSPAMLLALALLPSLAMAQQQPLTGQMMGGYRPAAAATPTSAAPAQPVTAAAATAPATTQSMAARAPAQPSPVASEPADAFEPAHAQASVAEPFYPEQTGDTTRHLLQMQADDSRPGSRLPILGDEASASYRRYMKSFDHDIPEFYEATVEKDNGNGR